MATMEKLGKAWFGQTCKWCGVRDDPRRFQAAEVGEYETGDWWSSKYISVIKYRCPNCGQSWEVNKERPTGG